MLSRYHSNPYFRAGQGLLFGALCALCFWMADSLNFSKGMDRSVLDAQFRARGITFPSSDIVIVEADDSTIERYSSWPLPRRAYAELIDHLTKAGAKTIAFDVRFPTESSSAFDDKALVEATQKSGRVVHAAVFEYKSERDPSISVGSEGNAHLILPRFQIPNRGLSNPPQTVWGLGPMQSLQKGSMGLGHVNAPPAEDGVLRYIPNILLFRSGQKTALYPSLALSAAANFLDVRPDQIQVQANEIVLPSKHGERRVPFDAIGNSWVNWVGPHDSFPTHSFNAILDGTVPDSLFKDKIVLIGITAAGAYERQATPFTRIEPAVELQANALNDILTGRSLRIAPISVWFSILLFFPALIGAVTLSRSAKASVLFALGLCTSLWFISVYSLSHLQLILLVATPLGASLAAWVVCTAYRQFLDATQLRQAEERYALAVRGANDGLWDWDLKTGQIYYSPRWKSMLGYADHEIGSSIEDWYKLVHPDDLKQMKAQLEAHLSGGVTHFESQHRMIHRDGRALWVLARGLRVCGADGTPTRMAGSQSDISMQIEAHQQLERNAFYDSLTGLPNRALFMNMLGRSLNHARRRNRHPFAVLFLDLDRFKTINDSLGHASGDALLIQVAQRIERCLRPGDTAARLGGDEFTVLLDDIDDAGDATRVAERIQFELTKPFVIAGQEVFPSSSIGIALSSPAYEQSEDLLRDADTAMYRAKSQGRARHAVFDEAMHEHALSMLRLETDLRRALERDNFLVFYQPIVSLQSGELTGFEALVRWKHPERGMVSPADFIPLAEETGLIIQLDHMVLREACCQVVYWQKMFPSRPLTISVNLSSKQFGQPNLVSQIKQTLADTELPPSSLKLEITEGVLMNNPESAATMLHQLRELGIKLSIDDFGTGYSSLSYLHRFPLDTLKVDQSFVRRMGENGENSEIVHTIVALARNLNMDVIAEGIETQFQLEQLRDVLCDYGQGYYFARPLPSADAEALLAKGTVWEAAAVAVAA